MGKRQKGRETCGLYGGLGSTSDSNCRPTKLSILVHSNVVGVIIGRGGSTIKEIMEQTSVRINVSKKYTVGNSEKPIAIYGTPENCTNACRKILEVVQQKSTDTSESNATLRILIHDNIIGLIIGEEGNTIRNIMSETETKIYVFGINDITIDNDNYKRICIVEGSIENISKAESQISAKLRQSFKKYLHQVAGCQINIEPATEMRNFCETGLPHFSYDGPGATPIIRNRQTESMLSILVHSNAVGVIIGRGGSTIKKITEQTSVRVYVQSKCNFDSMEQAIIIKGNQENCTNACLNILEILQQKANNTCSSNVVLKILIPDNIIGIIIEEEGNMIRKIMSETETKINVSSITDITTDSFNYRTICTIEGSLQNTSKAEGQISAKLRQSIEHFLHSVDGCQIKVVPALQMKNLCEIGHTRVSHVGPKTIPAIENKEFTLRILVQSDMIPVIIGKHGSTIKEITQQTSTKVHVDRKDSFGSTEKAITIKGIPENCTNVCRKMLDIIQKTKVTNTCNSNLILKILVHNDQVGVIIGEEGNTIRKIMSETETNITVPSMTDIMICNVNKERIFTIKGSVENISNAEAQISAKLRLCLKNISAVSRDMLVSSEGKNITLFRAPKV